MEGMCSSPLWSQQVTQQLSSGSESTVGLRGGSGSESEDTKALWSSLGMVPMDSDELTGEACVSLSLSLGVSLSLSLCLALSLPLRPFSFSLSSPSPGVFLPCHPPHPFSLSLSLLCLCLILHPPACWLLSGISPFAWQCAQQRVEEPYSVSGYRVCLPEERFLEQPHEISSARQPYMHAVSISAHRGGHRSVSLCRRTVEDCLPLERMPLACTLGSPLNPHVRQSLSLQGPVDLDHHRVEFLVVHQQWLSMFVHNFTVHPGAVRLVQSEPDLPITGPGHSGQLGIDSSQPFFRYGV